MRGIDSTAGSKGSISGHYKPWDLKKESQEDLFSRLMAKKEEKRKTQRIGPSAILLPFHLQETLWDSFIQIVSDFCSKFERRWSTFIIKYYGLDGSRYTLNGIGQEYEITRERVRQIKKMILSDLIAIFKGETRKGLRCDQFVLQEFHEFRDELRQYKILTQDGFEILCRKWGFEFNPQLLSAIFEIDVKSERGKKFYVVVKGYKIQDFERIYRKIFNLLKGGYQLTLEEIRTRVGNYRLVPSLLLGVPEKDGVYQIPFKDLNKKAQVHRILLEKNRKMHYTEIDREIKKRGGKGRLMVCKSTYVSPIGKSGYWVLKGSQVNKSTYTQMMLDIVETLGVPIKLSSLIKTIKLARPEFKAGSAAPLIHKNEKMILIEGGRVALEEWKKYGKRIQLRSGSKTQLLMDEAQEILKAAGELRYLDLCRELSRHTGIPQKSCETFVCRFRHVFRRQRRGSSAVFYSLSGREKILEKKVRENPKRDQILNYLKNRLKAGSQRRTELVSEASNELGVSSLYAYKLIQAHPELFLLGKRQYGRGKNRASLVSLKEY